MADFVGKLEVVRGAANAIRFWRRRDGRTDLAEAPAASVLGFWDPVGAALEVTPLPTVTVASDGALTFPWTPGAGLFLGEDYRFEIQYTGDDGVTRIEPVYFDLVRRSLACPVDHAMLSEREPVLLPKVISALGLADASGFIVAAWSHIVARVRAMGHRPALVTDRHAFTEVCITRALELAMAASVRAAGDVFDRKVAFYQQAQVDAWNAIGPVRFADPDEGVIVAGQAGALPRFRL